MSVPAGRREFFVLEAGEYLERLALAVTRERPADVDALVRYARALRGAALMAGPAGYAVAGAALESTAKAAKDGSLAWTPVAAERISDALEGLKALLRKARDWSEADQERCERIADDLDHLLGTGGERRARPRTPGASAALSAGVRAYVAREAAAVAGTLEQVAAAIERRPAAESAEPLALRLQPLRGLGALPDLSPLPELIEALDLTVAQAGRGGAWPPAAGRALRAVGAALSRMARDIAELGIPQHDSPEINQATALLREAFGTEDDVVPVESLVRAGDEAPIVRRGSPPPPPAPNADSTVELVSLADRFRHAAEQERLGPSAAARALQHHALAFSLRGLALSPAVRRALRDFLPRLDREIMSGRLSGDDGAAATVLARASGLLSAAAGAEDLRDLTLQLKPLCDDLDAAVKGAGPPVVPIESLAPENEDIVPIESLFFDAVSDAAPPPGLTAFERSFSTWHGLGGAADAAALDAIVPIGLLAPEPARPVEVELPVVPIQALLFRGRRALERADLVRRELDAALRSHRDLSGVETLLAELLDLVPLALDDER